MPAIDAADEGLDIVNSLLIVGQALLNPFAGVEDRGVVTTTEGLADHLKRCVGPRA
jgi:hypothetical protein